MLIKVIKFAIKFKICDFHYPHIPICNFQNSVSEKMWCCLTFVCVYIYPTELQLNKANTSDKETSFLDLNIKVIGNDVHTCVYDKRDDFGFPIVNFPWLSGDVPRLPSYGVYISQLVRLAFRISILKIFNLLPNYKRRVTDITSFEKHSESSSGHTLTCCLNVVKYRFKNMLRKEFLTRSSTVI